jgi:hypothetical protein
VLCSLAAFTGVSTLAGVSALAQDQVGPPEIQAPDESGPNKADDASSAPMDLFGSGLSDPDEAAMDPLLESVPALPGATNSIDVGLLGSVGNSVTGLLGPDNGGLGLQMWSGTGLGVAEEMVPLLPEKSASPIARSLGYRLLLSQAHPPEGIAEGKSMLALRLEKLYGLGFLDEAKQMSRQDLSQAGDVDILQVGSKIELLNDDIQRACGNAARTRTQSNDAFWLKLRAICYVVAKDLDAARLSADLLEEDGHDDAAYFSLLWNAIDNVGLETPAIADASALHLALLKLNGVALPPASVRTAQLPVQLRVATTGFAGGGPADLLEARLPAAEFATKMGALDGRRLAILYKNVPFLGTEIQAVTDGAYENPSAEARAALFQLAEGAPDTVSRAQYIKKALDVGRLSGTYETAAKVYGPMIAELAIQDNLAPMAMDFGGVLFAVGEFDRAGYWLDLAIEKSSGWRKSISVSDDLLGTYHSIRMLEQLPEDQLFAQWDPVQRLGQATSERSYRLAAREVKLFEALGAPIGVEVRQLMVQRPLQTSGQMPDAGILSGLDSAARAGRVGETVLYSLVALGEAGPEGAPAPVVERVVAGLARVGLTQEARIVAIESLLSAAYEKS